MKLLIVAFFISPFVFLSCKKSAGTGGSSSITGTVMSINHTRAKAEITEIIVTPGLQVEHGDYWLLNSVNSSQYFYIWYDNPAWISNGDPNLSGRTGISVPFNYSDLNTEIATNTANTVTQATNGIFSIEIINDILRITNTEMGDVSDADKVTSPFEFNIAQQGKNATSSISKPLVDEKVYLTYGDNTFYDDVIRTGVNGKFEFKWLNKGNYTISVASKDTLSNTNSSVDAVTEVNKNKSTIDIGALNVVK